MLCYSSTCAVDIEYVCTQTGQIICEYKVSTPNTACTYWIYPHMNTYLPRGTSGKESDRRCGGISDFYTIKTNKYC